MQNKPVNHSIRIVNMLSLSWFLLWLLYYFNAAPLYFELLVFHEKIISVSVLMAIWILIMLATIMLRGRIAFTWRHASLFTLVMYLLITTIIQYAITPNIINVIGMSSFGTIVLHIALFSILMAQMMVPGRISQATVYKWLLILSVPVIYFGISQVINGYSPITMVIFNDYVKNVPYDFYGFNRPYSFFTQSSNFGWYMAFLVALLWLSLVKSPSPLGKSAYFFALIIAVTANILSFTRIAILAMLLVILFIWYSKELTTRKNKAEFMPAVFFIAVIILFFFAGELSELLESILGVFAHSSSTSIRENELAYYLNIFGSAKWWQIIIGIGPIINSVSVKTDMFIDNTYLYLLLQEGVVGLALWLFVTVMIWRDMYLVAQREPTILRIAIIAFWSTWLAVDVFATDLSSYILMAIIFYMLNPKVVLRSSVRNLETKVGEA
jgi:O-antigen ligase